jgi:putative transposase
MLLRPSSRATQTPTAPIATANGSSKQVRATATHRRIAALLKRERRSDGLAPVKREAHLPLMRKQGLWLERHTGRRRPREHDGQVATIRSNCRWCSDALEFTREVIRVAFALDCHDREAISWVAITAGISGEMIRDIMVRCVEQRFAGSARRIRCSGSPTRARSSPITAPVEIALALNLVPCFTPVESPESNGMAEGFVKTFKRDYVRVRLIPSTTAALALSTAGWRMTTPCIRIPGWATAHPGSTSCPNPPRVRFNGVNYRSKKP